MERILKDYLPIDLIGKRFIDKNNRLEHYILEKNGIREYRILGIEGRRNFPLLGRKKYKYLEFKIKDIHLFIEYENYQSEADSIHININEHLNDELIE